MTMLYIIYTVCDPGGLYAPLVANHIKIMHLRIVGDHSQHPRQHNRFTLVQRTDIPRPTPNQRVLTYMHMVKGV